MNVQKQGQNLVHVFNSKSGCMHAVNLFHYEAQLPNLKLKTWSKQRFCFIPIAFVFLPYLLILDQPRQTGYQIEDIIDYILKISYYNILVINKIDAGEEIEILSCINV